VAELAFEWIKGLAFVGLSLALTTILQRLMTSALAALDTSAPVMVRSNGVVAVAFAVFCMFYFQTWPLRIAALGLALSLWLLALADWHSGLLPDRFTFPLLWAGLLVNLFIARVPVEEAVLGAALGYGFLWALVQAFYWLSGRHGMGYGDLKLTAALGAWLGWQPLLPVLLVASLSGLLWVVICRFLYSEPWARVIIFGPWLALAGFMQFLIYYR